MYQHTCTHRLRRSTDTAPLIISCLLNLWFSLCHVGPGNRIDSICVYHILADSVWTTVPKMAPTDLQDQSDRKDPSNMGTLCTGECWLSPVNLSCRPLFSWMSKPAPYFCLLVLCMCILVCNSIRTFKNVAKPGTSNCVNTYIRETNACWWKNLNIWKMQNNLLHKWDINIR